MKERFETFTVLIANISRSIRKIKTEEMSEFDLKSAHVSCLYYLYKANMLTARELCDVCGEDKANVSRSLEYLEEQGYVEYVIDAQKRYKSPLKLTEKGEQTAARIAQKIDGILDIVGEDVAIEDREIMYRALLKISENLSRKCEDYKNK